MSCCNSNFDGELDFNGKFNAFDGIVEGNMMNPNPNPMAHSYASGGMDNAFSNMGHNPTSFDGDSPFSNYGGGMSLSDENRFSNMGGVVTGNAFNPNPSPPAAPAPLSFLIDKLSSFSTTSASLLSLDS